MVSKKKIIYDILSIIRGGQISDDEEISVKQIGFWIDNMRSALIRQQIAKNQTINPDVVQTIPCLDVIQTTSDLCPCSVKGCTILRSKEKVPPAVETEFKNLIVRVSSPSVNSISFSEINIYRAPYVDFSKTGKSIPKYFIHGGYLYILSDIFFDKVSYSAVFQYPEDLRNFYDCDGIPCYTDDSLYPMSNNMIEIVKDMIFKLNARIILSAPSDVINNSEGRVVVPQGLMNTENENRKN